jgi:hypothetical protein
MRSTPAESGCPRRPEIKGLPVTLDLFLDEGIPDHHGHEPQTDACLFSGRVHLHVND